MAGKRIPIRINMAVKPGSALERTILAAPNKTVASALSDMAAAFEAVQRRVRVHGDR